MLGGLIWICSDFSAGIPESFPHTPQLAENFAAKYRSHIIRHWSTHLERVGLESPDVVRIMKSRARVHAHANFICPTRNFCLIRQLCSRSDSRSWNFIWNRVEVLATKATYIHTFFWGCVEELEVSLWDWAPIRCDSWLHQPCVCCWPSRKG